MSNVELKSIKLRQYIETILGKKQGEAITQEDLENILSLKLDKQIIKDLSMEDLLYFKKLQTLSLSGVNIGDSEIDIINRLDSIETLSISNASLNINKSKCISKGLQSLIFVNCEGVDITQFNENPNIAKLTIVNCRDTQLKGISQLGNLEEINLPGNEDLTDGDIEDIWNIENLKKVNLDGDNKISDVEREGVEISHEEEYAPAETADWNRTSSPRSSLDLSYFSSFSPEQLSDFKNANIDIRADDLEFLKSDKGQEIIKTLGENNNHFNLTLKTTADMSLEDIEALNGICRINRVYVQTGWSETQNMGYSYETYKAIKQKILSIIADIDPDLPEEQKYIAIRKKISSINYDYAVLNATPKDKDYYTSRNLENGLLSNTCVCAGFADIMKNILAEVGIESKYVEGKTSKGELHAWNQVRLKGDDGEYHWYNDDVTWDASGNGQFKYCLLDDKEFSKTHKCIGSRTEGGFAYKCTAVAPAAVRAEKNKAKTEQDPTRKLEEDGR